MAPALQVHFQPTNSTKWTSIRVKTYVLLGYLYISYSIYLEHLQSPGCDKEPHYLIAHSLKLVYIIDITSYM